MSTTLTVRLDDETKAKLDRLAKATSRTKSYLVSNAIREFIDVNEWQIQEITRTVREAHRTGAKFADHEEVSSWLSTWGSKKEKDPPRCK
jgi:predicted transcriptional regulator